MRRPLPFASRVFLAVTAALLITAGLGGAAAWWLASPWAVLLAAMGIGVPVGWWILGRVMTPASQVLGALRDGVRGFQDHDFSLSLAVDRKDELGELVALYNKVGDLLREERGNLIQREMLLATVLEATPTAIVLTQRVARENDRILFSNRSARDLFAVGGRLEGKSFGRILEDCPAALREALESGRDALLSVEMREQAEAEVFHASRRSFELNGQRHDLTMIQRMTQELRRQEVDVWKKAIRTMSHEINNSLAPIASLARSARHIAENPAHRERLGPVLDIIEERSAHLRDFLEGYAHFARLPAPRQETVAWGPFLTELGQLFPFVMEGEPPARPGRFDRSQIQQALINLLKNAQESGSPPQEIRLAVEETAEGGARLRVLDRGSGMSEEELKKALLPFYTSKATGSGLGLPLCREIVEAHSGHLRIERRPGGGTEVVCWLPGE